jgi:hypothetical protein
MAFRDDLETHLQSFDDCGTARHRAAVGGSCGERNIVTQLNHQCSHHAQEEESLREFWARAPADALGVKQELEKALALDGKPPK